jgi:hypothetical protein
MGIFDRELERRIRELEGMIRAMSNGSFFLAPHGTLLQTPMLDGTAIVGLRLSSERM